MTLKLHRDLTVLRLSLRQYIRVVFLRSGGLVVATTAVALALSLVYDVVSGINGTMTGNYIVVFTFFLGVTVLIATYFVRDILIGRYHRKVMVKSVSILPSDFGVWRWLAFGTGEDSVNNQRRGFVRPPGRIAWRVLIFLGYSGTFIVLWHLVVAFNLFSSFVMLEHLPGPVYLTAGFTLIAICVLSIIYSMWVAPAIVYSKSGSR